MEGKISEFTVDEAKNVIWKDGNVEFKFSRMEVLQMAVRTGILKEAVDMAIDKTLEAVKLKMFGM